MRHVLCILLLEWSTTSQRLWVWRISVPYAQKDPRFLFKKRRGQPREFWSLVSTIDGSTLPQDCVEDLPCGTLRNWYINKIPATSLMPAGVGISPRVLGASRAPNLGNQGALNKNWVTNFEIHFSCTK